MFSFNQLYTEADIKVVSTVTARPPATIHMGSHTPVTIHAFFFLAIGYIKVIYLLISILINVHMFFFNYTQKRI